MFVRVSRLLLLLCQVFVAGQARGHHSGVRILTSPCPQVFRYETNAPEEGRWPSENPRWRGVVRISPPKIPIVLNVRLLVPIPLSSKYVGRISLSEGKDQVVRKIQNGSLKTIKYYIYFPANVPIPEVILIKVNSRVVCSRTVPVPHKVKTILTLEHSLMTVPDQSWHSRPAGFPAWKQTTREKGLKETNFGSDAQAECGRENFRNSSNVPGNSVSYDDWPWMVPLFKKTILGLQFLCSSTLVTYRLVVTAAHCLKRRDFPALDREDVVAFVGRLDITNWTEDGSQPREILQVFIHPDFDPGVLHSDLAVLKFDRAVDPSPRVVPACLWLGNDDLSAVVGVRGVVFGWGTDGLGNKVTPTPQLAVMPIISQEECLRSKLEFLFLTTNRTLCAGFRNGTGPCSGDSGGGLLIPVRDDDGLVRWFLRGVVSLSLLKSGDVMCDVHEYSVFTDVAKYQDWILGLE